MLTTCGTCTVADEPVSAYFALLSTEMCTLPLRELGARFNVPPLSVAVPLIAVTVHFAGSICVPPNESTSIETGGVTPGGGVMVIDAPAECDGAPPGYCPVMVNDPEAPVEAGSVVNVSVELPPAITEDGSNVALVTPGGNPEAESVTNCATPETTAV